MRTRNRVYVNETGTASAPKYSGLTEHITLAKRIQKVVTMEEGTIIGGFGSAIVELLNDNDIHIPVLRLGIPDVLVDHASPDQSKETLGLTSEQMSKRILNKFKR